MLRRGFAEVVPYDLNVDTRREGDPRLCDPSSSIGHNGMEQAPLGIQHHRAHLGFVDHSSNWTMRQKNTQSAVH